MIFRPVLLVNPFASVVGDRLNRKIIMVVPDLASGVVIQGLAFIAYSDRMSLTLLFAVRILTALLYGFLIQTKGMLPQLAVERVTVMLDGRVVFTFKDGTKVEG